MAPPDGDPQWDCGQASALFGIAARTEWERENGVIDAAAYEARMAALVDAWRYAPFGNSPVTDAVRATSGAADAGVGPDDSAFQVAANDLRVACDAAGSLILTSALPGMGG